MQFLENLALKGLIQQAQIVEIKRIADEKYLGNLDKALVDFGISEEQIISAKSEYFNIPAKKVDVKSIDPTIFKYIPLESVNLYKIVPIGMNDGVLDIGITTPENVQAMDAIQFITNKTNLPFKIFLISDNDLNSVVGVYNGVGGEIDQALSQIKDQEVPEVADANVNQSVEKENPYKLVDISKEQSGEEKSEDAPIIKIVAVILRNAIEGNASDIHIENSGEKVKVRFRVDGVLHTSLLLPISSYMGIVARIKILAKLRLDEKRKPQDGGFSAKIDGRKIDFRVSTMPSYYGEKIVMRILDSDKGVKPLSELDLSPENLALIREAIKRPYGLILITGPTGSGKTTTLYSMLNEVDHESANIVSLEDPVEYQMQGVNQSQVMPEIGYTFASGLRSILRQDPNVIMVGEIRDKETAELAIQAALTGHLVLSTLHTNNAVGAIPRLIDMGIDPYLISPTLLLVVAQRLTHRICPTSKKSLDMDDSMKQMIEKEFADLPEEYKSKLPIQDAKFTDAVSSAECPSGVRGRVACFEMFRIDKEIQNIILKNPVESEIYKIARSKGMITMRQDAIIKSIKGMIPFRDVFTL